MKAARAKRVATPGFVLQARDRSDPEARTRIGFTCSKKVGNAVSRNRAKRRLREIAAAVMPELGQNGWDYVLIGRHKAAATLPFAQLQDDLRRAIAKIHTGRS